MIQTFNKKMSAFIEFLLKMKDEDIETIKENCKEYEEVLLKLIETYNQSITSNNGDTRMIINPQDLPKSKQLKEDLKKIVKEVIVIEYDSRNNSLQTTNNNNIRRKENN